MLHILPKGRDRQVLKSFHCNTSGRGGGGRMQRGRLQYNTKLLPAAEKVEIVYVIDYK